MATTLPANATKDNSDSVLDDPEQALLVDLAGVIDKFNSLKSALGAAALYNIAEGLGVASQGGGMPDDLKTAIAVSGKSGAYTITTTDRSKLIRATGAGGFTLSFTAAATLGDGWFCFVRNDATGTVTLDPNGAETIDGATTLTLDPGQSVLVFCNGSLLVTSGQWNINALENVTAGSPSTTVDADNDELLIYDASEGRHKKVSPSNLTIASGLVPLTRISSSDVASYNFTIGLDSSYRTYVLSGWLRPATDDVNLFLRTDSNGGASFDAGASDYGTVWQTLAATNSSSTDGTIGQIYIAFNGTGLNSIGNDAGYAIQFHIRFTLGSANEFPYFISEAIYSMATSDNRPARVDSGGTRNSAEAINAVQLLFDSGNVAAGDVTLYGQTNA